MSNPEIEDPYILVLKKPVTLGTEYVSLTLTEPTCGQVDEATKRDTNHGTNIALISLVAKVPEGVARKLSYTDYKEAVKYLENFTENTLETGAISSPK